MWLRWTDVKPVYHVHPKMKRGREVHSDGKYCFVEYHDIEQTEPGDTLVHTFAFPGWFDCRTCWWYFWATADGESTPSNTPIYKAHYPTAREAALYINSLGILADPNTLVGDVKLEEGAGITISRYGPFNSLIISHFD